MTKRPLLTIEDVAAHYGVPVATLYAWRHRGIGPKAAKIGRHLRYREADVEAWFEQQTGKAS